jgi:general secretion pathway protein N
VSGRRLAMWFAGAFALALVALMPLQLVLPRTSWPPGLAASEVGGSLWRGTLRQAHWRGAALGDLRLGLSPLPLLTGRQQLWVRAPHARLAVSAGRLRGISGGNGVLPLPPVSGLALRASLEEARMLFDETGCREAGGRVRIEVALPGDTLPPLVLAGTPACDGRSGRLVLAPEDPTGSLQVEATLSIEADGGYRLQSLARSDDPALRAALMLHGFQEAAGSLSRVLEGRLAPP